MGEKSNPPLLMGANAALDFLLEFGVDAISDTLGQATQNIADRTAELGLESANLDTRAPYFLSLQFADGEPPGLTDRLASAQVYVSLRGSSLRVTRHVYNTEADTDALIATLRHCIR